MRVLGMLYYGFSVLLLPMVSELHSSRAVVAGAFSLGLLVMALAAPQIGRWSIVITRRASCG